MNFLYKKIYTNQSFLIILFAVIAVLLALFVIILIIAIRDTKKSKIKKLEEEERVKIENAKNTGLMSSQMNLTDSAAATEATAAPAPEEPKKEESYDFFANENELSKTKDMVLTEPTEANQMSGLLNEFEAAPAVAAPLEATSIIEAAPAVAAPAVDVASDIVETAVDAGSTSLDELIANVATDTPQVPEVAVEPTVEEVATPEAQDLTIAMPEATVEEIDTTPVEPAPFDPQAPLEEVNVISIPNVLEAAGFNVSELPSVNAHEISESEGITPEGEVKEEIPTEPTPVEEVTPVESTLVEVPAEAPVETPVEVPTEAPVEAPVETPQVTEAKVDAIPTPNIDLESTGVLNFSSIQRESYDIKDTNN